MKLSKNVFLTIMFLLLTSPIMSYAKCCGKVQGHKIVTYGGLSCTRAKSVYKSFLQGKIPPGWNCGQSVGGCGKGKQGFTFKLN